MGYEDSEYDKELYEDETDKELMDSDSDYDEDLVEFEEHPTNVGEEPEDYESEVNHFRR